MGWLRWLFVAFLAGTALHLGAIMLREPFAFDAWNMTWDTHGEPITASRFFDYWGYEYTHSNPRVGQPLTYLAYKLVWFAPIATPLVFVALAIAAFVLGTGRWPSARRGRDLALLTMGIGFQWFALPHIGMIMFCRAYSANYLFTAAIQLWFLVPLRMVRREDPPVAWLVAYGLFGVIAGACNEHTGPTLCAFMLGYAGWQWLTRASSRFVGVGALGAVAGFAAIFFAPGQNERYQGAVQKVGLVQRMLARGLPGNFDIVADLVLAAAPLLVVLAVVVALSVRDGVDDATRLQRQRAWRVVVFAMLASLLIAITLFVSPRLGPRFYLVPMSLLLAGVLAVADGVLVTPRRLAPFVIVAVLASGYAALRTLPLYSHLDRESDARLAELVAAPRGATVTVASFDQVDESWWALGDDFRDAEKRRKVAEYLDLGFVTFRAVDLEVPLGVSDVHLVPRAKIEPASCIDTYGGLDLLQFHSFDILSIHEATQLAIDQLRTRLPAGARLDQLDVVVQFAGAPPPLPRPSIVLGRWTPVAGYEGHTGKIVREGRTTLRDVVPPPELASGYELFIYQVGGEWRPLGKELNYSPWKPGPYWALACTPAECFVFAAIRHL